MSVPRTARATSSPASHGGAPRPRPADGPCPLRRRACGRSAISEMTGGYNPLPITAAGASRCR